MRDYQLITLCSKYLQRTTILIQVDNRGRFAIFEVQSDDLIKELDEDIKTLICNGYNTFNVILLPAYLIFNRNRSSMYNLCYNLGLEQPPIGEIIPFLKGCKFVLFNADDQDMKIEL